MWSILLVLIFLELGCLTLRAATGAGPLLAAALTTGVAIVYLAVFPGR